MPARRRFTAEFKTRVVKDAMREANTLNAVVARHGIHPSQVRDWRRQFEQAGAEGFRRGAPKGADDQAATIKELHAKIGELTMEKDFFCRALGR